MRRLANGFKEIAGGMMLGIADNGDSDAEASCSGSFRYGLSGVVRSFGVNIGAESFEERFDARFAEEDDVIDTAKSSDKLGAGIFVENRAAGAFEGADAGVGIDANDEDVAFTASAFEIADVANVKGVKATVCENDALSALLVLR
jgi:hypothetical protein